MHLGVKTVKRTSNNPEGRPPKYGVPGEPVSIRVPKHLKERFREAQEKLLQELAREYDLEQEQKSI